ncbi:MAG: hypothetical protein Q4D51_11970 [Eubacteriales bacterium]|nr:hypothetical protein [Eubacteriales bacterium]
MPDYMTTYGGTHFYPTKPVMEDIHIRDIAHALSLLCRGNGQVTHFFSVGQHCINCCREAKARGYSNRLVLACLLHDASEAYMADLIRPLKKDMPEYIRHEEHLLQVIYEKYLGSPLSEEEQRLVKIVDDDMLYFDMLNLLKEPQNRPEPVMKSDFSQEFVPFEQVEQQYLELFHQYYN